MAADLGDGEELMITDYFERPGTLQRMRTSCVIDEPPLLTEAFSSTPVAP